MEATTDWWSPLFANTKEENIMPNQDGAGSKGKGPKDGHGKGKGSGNCNGSCKETGSGQGAMTGGKKGDKDKNKK